jgi:hypothetical protein
MLKIYDHKPFYSFIFLVRQSQAQTSSETRVKINKAFLFRNNLKILSQINLGPTNRQRLSKLRGDLRFVFFFEVGAHEHIR